MLQRVWMSHVQMLRGRMRRDLKTMKRHGKSWASGTRTVGAVRPGRYSGGVFRVTATMRRVHRALEELYRAKYPRLAVGHRQSMVARIAQLAGAKSQLKRRFVHIDGEYASSNEWSLVWREVDTAFESRILTGAVINSNHIEPQRFLEDAANVALERVRDAVERHGSVKVNTVFNGEFVTKNKRANKSIITKNSEIHRFARVARHRAYPSIAPRAFQERDSGWALSRIFNLTINVYKLNPLRAECHRSTTRNSDKTNGNQCSYDGQYACFAWSVVAALYLTEKYTERESSYPHYDSTESHKHWVPKDFKRHF